MALVTGVGLEVILVVTGVHGRYNRAMGTFLLPFLPPSLPPSSCVKALYSAFGRVDVSLSSAPADGAGHGGGSRSIFCGDWRASSIPPSLPPSLPPVL